MKCPVCGKQFYTTYPENWPFRCQGLLFCGENCKDEYANKAGIKASKEKPIAEHAVRKIWRTMRYGYQNRRK